MNQDRIRWRPLALALACLALSATAFAQTPPADMKSAPEKLKSNVYVWENLEVKKTANGERRAVFDGPSATVDLAHCHITTLNPGEKSSDPRLHLQEEIIIVKEGSVEAYCDGKTTVATPGSVIYFAANATTALRNVGKTPATYIVVYYTTPLTPKAPATDKK